MQQFERERQRCVACVSHLQEQRMSCSRTKRSTDVDKRSSSSIDLLAEKRRPATMLCRTFEIAGQWENILYIFEAVTAASSATDCSAKYASGGTGSAGFSTFALVRI